jgi:hypothetical protein
MAAARRRTVVRSAGPGDRDTGEHRGRVRELLGVAVDAIEAVDATKSNVPLLVLVGSLRGVPQSIDRGSDKRLDVDRFALA